MAAFNRFVAGLRALIWKRRADRELDEELHAYLDMSIERKRAAGIPYEEAVRTARAEMGSVDAIKEHMRDGGWETRLESFVRDLRLGVRALLAVPRVTVPAVVTLALGIGATAAIFSVMRTVLFAPLPYQDPDRVVAVWETTRGGVSRNSIAPANFVVWRERSRTLDHLSMVGPRSIAMMLDGEPLQIVGLSASASVFRALGVRPALGRPYTDDEDGADSVIVLSHEFWQRVLGGRPDVLGLTLVTDGRPRTIVGVMPPRFTIAGQAADFLAPYGLTTEQLRAERGRGGSYALARLRNGTTFDDAYEEMRAIYAALEREEPQRNAARTVMLFELQDQMVGEVRPALLTLAAAVALLLVVACVNVASLLLARSAARRREVAMRTALGAGRLRLVRQMLTESLVLGAAGGATGIGVAALLHRGLLAVVRDRIAIPRVDQVTLDAGVVAFAMVIAVTTGVACGLVPALMSTSAAGEALREGGRHGSGRRLHRTLDSLVTAEVALSLLLLVGAGLLMRSFINQRSIDTGYRPDGVLAVRVRVPGTSAINARATAMVGEALTRVASLPGVQQAAAAACLPPPAGCTATSVWRLDRPAPALEERRSAQIRPVSPAFFSTLGVPQLRGRDFSPFDTVHSAPAAIVSESFVRAYFADESPIGKSLHINTVEHVSGSMDMPWTIVGVVPDIRSSLDGTTGLVVYVPLVQIPASEMRIFVRTRDNPAALGGTVRDIIRSIEPQAPIEVRTLDDVVAGTIARPRAVTILVGAFALLALTLAAVGVYGVIAYSVRERTREIGVRIALGATATAVARLVLGHALKLTVVGTTMGLLTAAGLASTIERLLFGVHPIDPVTFVVTPAVLLLVAALAAYIPARRGMRTPPADVLRAQ
jgi:putative ABC transport system permease protein